MSAPARHEDRRSLLFMNYIHARLFKRSLLVLSVKVAFTLLLPWIRRHEDFYRFTRILCSCTLLPSYAKMPTLLPYPHPMAKRAPTHSDPHARCACTQMSVPRPGTRRPRWSALSRTTCTGQRISTERHRKHRSQRSRGVAEVHVEIVLNVLVFVK